MIITLLYKKRALFLENKEIATREDYSKLTPEEHLKTYEKDIDTTITYDADGFEFVNEQWIKFINCTEHNVFIRTVSATLGDLIEVKYQTQNTPTFG